MQCAVCSVQCAAYCLQLFRDQLELFPAGIRRNSPGCGAAGLVGFVYIHAGGWVLCKYFIGQGRVGSLSQQEREQEQQEQQEKQHRCHIHPSKTQSQKALSGVSRTGNVQVGIPSSHIARRRIGGDIEGESRNSMDG